MAEDISAHIFATDATTQARFYASTGRSLHDPERALRLAMIAAAIDDLRLSAPGSSNAAVQQATAREWLTDERTDWPFSFRVICQALSLNAQYLRDGILSGTRPVTLRPAAAPVRQVRERVLEVLVAARAPRTPGQVRRSLGLDLAQVHNALRDLHGRSLVRRAAHGAWVATR